MSKFKTTLLRIIGRVKKIVTWWTTIGAMAIPLAIVLLLEAPNGFSSFWSWIALALMMFGAASIIFGWKNTLAEEKQRRREGIVSLYVLSSIAEKLGVDVDKAVKKLKELVDGK